MKLPQGSGVGLAVGEVGLAVGPGVGTDVGLGVGAGVGEAGLGGLAKVVTSGS